MSAEKKLPYDRTLLTKTLPFGDANKFVLRDQSFLDGADIDVINDSVYAIHTDKKKVTFNRAQPMDYDKILIATGGTARKPPIPGIDSKHVYFLRSANDQEKIKKQAEDIRNGVAIIGSGFIGSEAAAALKMKYKSQFQVHMIGMEEYPLELALGKEVGRMIAEEHENNGVILHMQSGVREIEKDSHGNVTAVVLNSGERISVDMVIVGTGIAPATKFLAREETGIKLDAQGAVICDPFLQSTAPDIYAAGDVCSFPYW